MQNGPFISHYRERDTKEMILRVTDCINLRHNNTTSKTGPTAVLAKASTLCANYMLFDRAQ